VLSVNFKIIKYTIINGITKEKIYDSAILTPCSK